MSKADATRTLLREMDDVSREIIKEKCLSAVGRIEDWLSILKDLALFDEITDRRHAKAKKIAIIAWVISVVVAFLAAMLAQKSGYGSAAVFAVAGIGLIIAIIFTVKTQKLGGIDLKNDFRESLLPFLEIIQEDIEPKGKVELDLELSSPISRAKKQGKTILPPGRFNKLTETLYLDPWCRASIPLAEGNRLELTIEKRTSAFDRSYRSSSGKHKTKRKWRMLTICTAVLYPNAENFAWDAEGISELSTERKIKLSTKKGTEVCRLVLKTKDKSGMKAPTSTVKPEALVGLCMDLCAMLGQSQERSAE